MSDPGRPNLIQRIRSLESELETVRAELTASRMALGAARAELLTVRETEEPARDRLEARLRRVAREESVGVLIAGVAHDFNNLLLNIVGNVGLVRRTTEPSSPTFPRLGAIECAARRASELARQLSAVAGGESCQRQEVDLGELVTEMASLVSTSIPDNIRVRHEVSPALPPLRADATQLRQVVMNLIVNAAEAIGERDGEITIRLDTVEIDPTYLAGLPAETELGWGEHLSLTVTDDGCGMSQAVRERIFDPFYSTKRDGRGLGLAAVLGIVHHHRGAIRVESTPGAGTTFELLLPAAVTLHQASGVRATGPRGGAGLVLVAEDDDGVRATLRLALEYAGFEVLAARDGKAAVESFRERRHSVDAVVLDLSMPVWSGIEVLHRVRELRPDIPVFVTSGLQERDGREALAGAQVDGFFEKPYALDELTARLTAVVARQQRNTG